MSQSNGKSVSVVDVARAAGVSLGTVSNALNRPERVKPETLERVHNAIATLGFVRNEAARQLRAGRSRSIGLVVLDVANPFFTDICEGVEEAAADAGLAVLLCNSNEDPTREKRYLNLLEELRAYGVLLTPVLNTNRQVKEMQRRGVPVVLVDRGSSRTQCSVSVDDVSGGELATRHLLERGHQRIAYAGGPLQLTQVADRLRGARAAYAAAGVDDAKLTVLETNGLTVSSGRRAGEQIAAIPARRRPTAAFCANDLVALGLLQQMTTHGVDVPGQLAIVGYDDIEFAAAAAVPLTSVRQPRSQLGRTATELLIEEVEDPGQHVHRQVVFAPELIERQSSAREIGRVRRQSSRRARQPSGGSLS